MPSVRARWEILVLIFESTDVSLDLGDGPVHLTAQMDPADADKAEDRAKAFGEIDIPALTEGAMIPNLHVERPTSALGRLSLCEFGWWPSPADVGAHTSSKVDSVIVIWEPSVSDGDGRTHGLARAGGVTSRDRGVQTCHSTLTVDLAVRNDHRNGFKHEFGHAILCYFRARGVAVPPEDNDVAQGSHVHFPDGSPYIWGPDETLSIPIPNSIYNNDAGFTHDYYSGHLASASAPTVRLGIAPDDWGLGGPFSPGLT